MIDGFSMMNAESPGVHYNRCEIQTPAHAKRMTQTPGPGGVASSVTEEISELDSGSEAI